MKKQDLLNRMDEDLLETLFGFCYARTRDSYEAQELCSDILFALVKTANTEGELADPDAYIWKTAHHVYADFCRRRAKRSAMEYAGDPDEILPLLPAPEETDVDEDRLAVIYRRIAYLTKAYRDVVILFYLDGLSTAEIAQRENVSETAVRQRLFAARKQLKKEVELMTERTVTDKPLALEPIEYVIWGSGTWGGNDPREGFIRQFSKQIVRLCREKPMSPSEIAEELQVPTLYVEEELELLVRGQNGSYGLLRKLENGKYGINIVLFDQKTIEQAHAIYQAQLPALGRVVTEYIQQHREEYLAFPYLNKHVDWNLILWQQISVLAHAFSDCVEEILTERYFADILTSDRPFSVFGYVDNGVSYGDGLDTIQASQVCGYSRVHLENIYVTRIRAHFHCGHHVAEDPLLLLALRAIHGLDSHSLSLEEKEHAARAIADGYLEREGDTLYTRILVHDLNDRKRLFAVSKGLDRRYFEREATVVAENIAALIRSCVPAYLLPDWKYANCLADLPVMDALIEHLIAQGILVPPEDGIGAEGCWMGVSKE